MPWGRRVCLTVPTLHVQLAQITAFIAFTFKLFDFKYIKLSGPLFMPRDTVSIVSQ